MANISTHIDPMKDSRLITIEIEKQFNTETEHSIIRNALNDVAKIYAEAWLEENKDKIYERLNVNAIANMIMVETAKQIKNDITDKDVEK